MLAAIALGSNLPSPFGDAATTLHEAVIRLQALGSVTAVSTFYDTAPVGYLDQPRFVNAAALLETTLAPLDLLHALLNIEKTFGRDRTTAPPKGPRTLDLDLLLYADLILADPDLQLPHPAMHERLFVLEPLNEIASDLQHPLLHQSIRELLTDLQAREVLQP